MRYTTPLFHTLLVASLLGLLVFSSRHPQTAWAMPNLQTAPILTFTSGLTVQPGNSIGVPLTFQSNGTSIGAISFALDFDQACLTYTTTTFALPAGEHLAVQFFATGLHHLFDLLDLHRLHGWGALEIIFQVPTQIGLLLRGQGELEHGLGFQVWPAGALQGCSFRFRTATPQTRLVSPTVLSDIRFPEERL